MNRRSWTFSLDFCGDFLGIFGPFSFFSPFFDRSKFDLDLGLERG